MLKVPMVPEAPFSAITDKSIRFSLGNDSQREEWGGFSTAVPFGSGNIRNLEVAKEALKQGIPLYVIDEVPVESRDFTDGKATQLMLELKKGGAIFVKHQYDLPSMLNLSKNKIIELKEQPPLAGHVKEPKPDE